MATNPEAAAHALAYAYVVNAERNEFIEKKVKIFELQDGDLNVAPEPDAKGWSIYSDWKTSAARNFASKMGVEGCYGAFSASASMAINSSSSESFRTVRHDEIIRSSVYRVTAGSELQLAPHKRLTPAAREFLMTGPVEAIPDKVGVFVATACSLGGTLHKTYIMEATAEDTESSVAAEVKASYMTVSASASTSYGQRSESSSLKTKMTWQVEGGNTAIWQGLTPTNFEEVQGKWASTISEANMFPSRMSLVPIWEVVAMLDPDRASELQAHLMRRWSEGPAGPAPPPPCFRPTDSPISTGDEVCLRNPSHGNQFVEGCGRAGAGFGVSTRDSRESVYNGFPTAKFTIHKFSGAKGSIASGDEVCLRNPAHKNEFVECCGKAGAGFGVSTRDSKESMYNGVPTAKFTIHKFSGAKGSIENGDEVYLRNPAHKNQFVECCGKAGAGFGVSTRDSKEFTHNGVPTAKFTIHRF